MFFITLQMRPISQGSSYSIKKPCGKLLMIEPANTSRGRFIYQNFHHEPFLPSVTNCKLPDVGQMSVANGALPWIVFESDWTSKTLKIVPELTKNKTESIFPLVYLLSGGLSWPQLLPKFMSVT